MFEKHKKGKKRGTISSAKCIQNGTKNPDFTIKAHSKCILETLLEFQKNQNSFDMQFNREIVCHPNS